MRIVAGTARGRRLVVPEGTTTRPTTDRVREAVFNALYSLGAIDDATVVDLFAGSGALGLEALSRGAAHCTFIERDRHALDAIRTNVDTLGFGDRSRIVTGDALRVAPTLGTVDLALADPPYDYAQWTELLDVVDARLLVAESANPLPQHPAWEPVRERTYGSTVVAILQPHAPARSAEEAP